VEKYQWLAKPLRGVSGKHMRKFYMAVVVPKMLYVADLLLIPEIPISKVIKGYINKLGRIQRQASLHVTGAMRSTPTDMADTCADLLADLLPFHLLVQKLTYCIAVRIVMLPHTHPLERHMSWATTRYIKRHRAPLHEVLHMAQVQPSEFEDILFSRHSPKWELSFPIHIPVNREGAIQEANEILKLHLGKETEHTVFEAELVSLVLAAKLVRMERNVNVCMAVLGVNSQAAI